jgi:hypothetical protein
MREGDVQPRGHSHRVGGRLDGLHVHAWGVGMAIQVWVPDTHRVPDSTGTGTGAIFYPWVAPVPDPNQDGYGTSIFSHPRVTRWVLDTLLPL